MRELRRYTSAPQEARTIRTAVFIEEQGFEAEFDEIDAYANHIVLFEDGVAQGTCRVFPAIQSSPSAVESNVAEDPADTNGNAQAGTVFIVGRVAVLKNARGKHYGALLMEEAGRLAHDLGGTELHLHSQIQAQGFYEKLGFVAFGPIELDEGVEHIWMKKGLM